MEEKRRAAREVIDILQEISLLLVRSPRAHSRTSTDIRDDRTLAWTATRYQSACL